MGRSTSKEAYRLWFEFLKHANTHSDVKVNKKFYAEWGDVSNIKFNVFWNQKSETLFKRATLELVTSGKSNDDSFLVRVPIELSPTQAANELRRILLSQQASNQNKKQSKTRYKLTDDTEIKVAAFRAYLHTYEAYLRVVERGSIAKVNRTGGKGGKLKVSGKELLDEVRLFYLTRTERWKHTKRKVEGLPPSLLSGLEINPVTGEKMSYSGDETSALRTVKRYLVNAEKLIANAAKGTFPGEL